ncbi:MAG: peptidase [Cyclobacteriaceae bacterium]
MTYCLGILSKEGVIGLADTRITTGTDTTTAKKIYTVNRKKGAFFIMTSGLRSIRDKAITYFNEVVENDATTFTKLYEVVNKFAEQVKLVAAEDKLALTHAGLHFNLHAIIGGQLANDKAPKLFLLYAEGNWIEIGPGTPYVIIGNVGYGIPILKRSLTYDSSLEFGLKSGFLSFDATRISANDVDYPIDTAILRKDTFQLIEKRFEEKDLRHLSEHWDTSLKVAINQLPSINLKTSFEKDDAQLSIENYEI